jgi:hypothetical protein
VQPNAAPSSSPAAAGGAGDAAGTVAVESLATVVTPTTPAGTHPLMTPREPSPEVNLDQVALRITTRTAVFAVFSLFFAAAGIAGIAVASKTIMVMLRPAAAAATLEETHPQMRERQLLQKAEAALKRGAPMEVRLAVDELLDGSAPVRAEADARILRAHALADLGKKSEAIADLEWVWLNLPRSDERGVRARERAEELRSDAGALRRGAR